MGFGVEVGGGIGVSVGGGGVDVVQAAKIIAIVISNIVIRKCLIRVAPRVSCC